MKASPLFVDDTFALIAGPCSIESPEQLQAIAATLEKENLFLLRGGIFKLRTSAQSFQGLGTKCFDWVKSIKNKYNLKIVSEITHIQHIEMMRDLVDVFQIGSRNMYNYELLKALGKEKKPVILKRGFSALVDEWLQASEYITRNGNLDVILCERGIRTFETTTRNTLDLNSVAYIKKHTKFKVIVDPSHGTGKRNLILPLSLAALAAGADGLLVEIHPNPQQAWSDKDQAINLEEFHHLVKEIKKILPIFKKELITHGSSINAIQAQTVQSQIHSQ